MRVLVAIFLDDEMCDAEATFLTLRTLRIHWDDTWTPAGVLILGPEEKSPERNQASAESESAGDALMGHALDCARKLVDAALEYFDGVIRVPISQGWLATSHALSTARREEAALLFLRPGTLFLRPWTHLLAAPPRFTALAAPPHYTSPSCALLWIPRASHDSARMALSMAESVGGAAVLGRFGGALFSGAKGLDTALGRAMPHLPRRLLHLLRPVPGGAAYLAGISRTVWRSTADGATPSAVKGSAGSGSGEQERGGEGEGRQDGQTDTLQILSLLSPPGACAVHLPGPHPPGIASQLAPELFRD